MMILLAQAAETWGVFGALGRAGATGIIAQTGAHGEYGAAAGAGAAVVAILAVVFRFLERKRMVNGGNCPMCRLPLRLASRVGRELPPGSPPRPTRKASSMVFQVSPGTLLTGPEFCPGQSPVRLRC